MAETLTLSQSIIFAIVTGIVPALLWLWFWLKQDAKKPEPKGLLLITFIVGGLMVFVVFPLERLAFEVMSGAGGLITPQIIATWATTEEVAKYAAFALVAMRTRFFDEPVDAVIYIITAALGFSAMENFLYTMNILNESGTLVAILNGNLRFLGASILHTVASAAVGIAIALAFYGGVAKKLLFLALGLTTASVLHTYFNLFIINTKSVGDLLTIFSFLWIIIIIILLLFEKIKRMSPQ